MVVNVSRKAMFVWKCISFICFNNADDLSVNVTFDNFF